MAEFKKGVGTDAITAIIAAILALANALDKKGALSFEEYRDALLSMYREMPHEDASGMRVTYSMACSSQLERAIRNCQNAEIDAEIRAVLDRGRE